MPELIKITVVIIGKFSHWRVAQYDGPKIDVIGDKWPKRDRLSRPRRSHCRRDKTGVKKARRWRVTETIGPALHNVNAEAELVG